MPKEKIEYDFHYNPEVKSWKDVKAIAQQAEAAGFDMFTLTDHFYNMPDPRAKVPFGTESHALDAWGLLAAVATCTEKIKIGTLVSCIMYRSTPMVLAKIATTVDIISGGRLVLGFGAGWHEQDFKDFIGYFPSVKERVERFGESMAIIRGMVDNEEFSFEGKYYKFENIRNSPRPVHGTIPLIIGAKGEKKTIRMAVKYADIIHFAYNEEDDVIKRRLDIIRDECKNIGRDFSEIIPSIAISQLYNPNEKEIRYEASYFVMNGWTWEKAINYVKSWPFTPEAAIERINRYVDMGVRLITMGGPAWTALHLIREFKDKVRPKLRRQV